MLLLTAAMDTAESAAQMITVLILFVAVLWVTWLVTKWTASYQKGKWKGSNIEVLESFRIAPDKYVQIVRVGNRYLAIAVSKDGVTMLTELEEDELILPDDSVDSKMNFKELFEKVREKKN